MINNESLFKPRSIALVIFLLAFDIILAQSGNRTTRSCATMDIYQQQLFQDPTLEKRRQEIERQTQFYINQKIIKQGIAVTSIPIVFHIVHNGDAIGTGENLSEALIMAQLEQLNDDFRRMNSDANNTPAEFAGIAIDTEIEFCLATRDPQGNPTSGIVRHLMPQTSWAENQIENQLKPNTIWDRDSYLNFWIVRFSSSDLLGYAQFPGGTANTDGVVCAYFSVGSLLTPNPEGGSFPNGRTGTHEVGHWLNLFHIWGDGNCNDDDQVADTPNQGSSSSGCPSYPQNSCSSSDMFMNYMDYSDDACMNAFTQGQKSRLDAVLSGTRSSLTSSQGCASVQDFQITVNPASKSICPPDNTAQYTINVAFIAGFNSTVTLSTVNLPSGATAQFNPDMLTGAGSSILTLTNVNLSNGSYELMAMGSGASKSHSIDLELTYYDALPNAIMLLAPINNATAVSLSESVSWSSDSNASNYSLEIATDMDFSNLVVTQMTKSSNFYLNGSLMSNTNYYWRVKASNPCGEGSYSDIWSFTTEEVTEVCNDFVSTNVPVNIIDESSITSTINIVTSGSVTDVNVLNISIDHTWISDLVLELESPTGTRITLINEICDEQEDMMLGLDDEGTSGIPCPPTTGTSYTPLNALSAFDGEDINGSWTLHVTDGYDFDIGTLDSWTLEICYESGGSNDCDNSTDLSNTISNGIYHITDVLTTAGTIPANGLVTLKSQNAVILNPNFNVENTGSLIIEIADCPN